ncbi:MAG: multidrug ABC transporter ATP-binding protein [Micavibrio aeruginosavorus]|uniref:Multidrug ABC transporter ATP-binding protein n=1 Tax=Micavibrio aeruginosavorus TaxID=349221 RepID=A0A2W5FPN7_9BACT|nr:MAG: multidrug ABC transporter ATP-binding protein [Micavibrio aeruginosavorus]
MLIRADHITHRYGRVVGLDDVSLQIPQGQSVAVIGPDGVGKSTLLGLFSGAKKLQGGDLSIFDGDVRKKYVLGELQQRAAYMPQGLGKNLYPELSIRENLEFFGRLYGHEKKERDRRIDMLTAATGLKPFLDRPAGKLSGGMKQKLGLCCSLIHDPELLILDEPTTGVDPLSRKQFWTLIDDIRAEQKGLTVIVATSYMEEADDFDFVVMMNDGKIIATGTPEELRTKSGESTLERAFISFLPEEKRSGHEIPEIHLRDLSEKTIAISAKDLTRRFGSFTAVDHVSFEIPKGEIFGFLGSNGCGKTTTMKMLTGLLPVSEGTSSLFGTTLVPGDMENRKRIGYMSQNFSLYGELTVDQNITLHARLFNLSGEHADKRIAWLYDRFDLLKYKDSPSGDLPLGVRQRLSLAVAVIHEPEILILDEPTSGVDPVARDNFWALLIELSRKDEVTIFISTHFMNEAERCDRISLMHAGKVLTTGIPDDLRRKKGSTTLDEAFVSYLEDAVAEKNKDAAAQPEEKKQFTSGAPDHAQRKEQGFFSKLFSAKRMNAYMRREVMEMMRDPIRLSIATLGTSLLMLVFGYGITMDVNSLRFAALDLDKTADSRAYIQELEGSPYFLTQPQITSDAELTHRMQSGSISMALQIPPDFGKDLHSGQPTEIAAWVDGSMPFRGETIGGYLQGIHARFLRDRGEMAQAPLTVEMRYLYNQSFESVNAMVPAVISLLLVFIPAILSALAVVREKEMGSIANMYVTPVTRLEFILGKQIPYVLFAMISFTIMLVMALLVFQLSIKGSLIGLILGATLYVSATTGLGLLISSFTKSQIAALFGAAITTMVPASQFSGLLQPVNTLEGGARWIGTFYPTGYFMKISVGTFTKGLDFIALQPFLTSLAIFTPALLFVNVFLLRKQET